MAQEIIDGLPTPFRLPPQPLVVSTWQGYMFEFVCCVDGLDLGAAVVAYRLRHQAPCERCGDSRYSNDRGAYSSVRSLARPPTGPGPAGTEDK